jgi:hypothetical protein
MGRRAGRFACALSFFVLNLLTCLSTLAARERRIENWGVLRSSFWLLVATSTLHVVVVDLYNYPLLSLLLFHLFFSALHFSLLYCFISEKPRSQVLCRRLNRSSRIA